MSTSTSAWSTSVAGATCGRRRHGSLPAGLVCLVAWVGRDVAPASAGPRARVLIGYLGLPELLTAPRAAVTLVKIGMVSQWYEPEPGAAAHPTAIARGPRRSRSRPPGPHGVPELSHGPGPLGYRMRLRSREWLDGIEVVRVPDVPSHDASALRACPEPRVLRGVGDRTTSAACGGGRVSDLPHPGDGRAASWTLRATRRRPVRPLRPGPVARDGDREWLRRGAAGPPGCSSAASDAALTASLRAASGVVALSPTMAATLADRGAGSPAVSIPNWVDEEIFRPAPRRRPSASQQGDDGSCTPAGSARCKRWSTRCAPSPAAWVQRRRARRRRRRRRARGLEAWPSTSGLADRVAFLGAEPMSEMPFLMAEASPSWCRLRDLPLFRGTIPSKIQASMACGAAARAARSPETRPTSSGVRARVSSWTRSRRSSWPWRSRRSPTCSRRPGGALGDAGRAAYVAELSAAAGGRGSRRCCVEAAQGRAA